MLTDYWQVWLPYAAAAVLLGALAVFAVVNVRVRMIAPAWTFATSALALAILAGIAATLADAASENDGLTVFDRPTWQWFVDHRSPGLTTVAKVVTDAGSTLTMGILAAGTVVLLWWRQRRGDAVMVAVVSAGAGLLVVVAKNAIGRVRPPEQYRLVVETNQSFPSGHALASTAILGVFTVLVLAVVRPTVSRIGVVLLAALVVVAIGLSRLYLGVHWATDILGGWTAGAGWLLLCLIVRRLYRSWTDNRAAGRPTQLSPGITDDD